MTATKEYFENNGYIVLKDALSKDQCNKLVQHMFALHDQGKLTKDDQCPVSDAIYGDANMEALLENFAGPIGKTVGKQLLPTYAYARIYRPGEVLKKHKDRPACEISATLTLGYDAKSVWPICFDEHKETSVDLDTGELAVYKGCEVLHWRKEFKGNWHVQVFLHYVDADGPHADQARDGRHQSVEAVQDKSTNNTATNIQSTKTEFVVKKPYYNSAVIPGADNTFPGYFGIDSRHMNELMFTSKECQTIIDLTKDIYGGTAGVGADINGRVERKIRDAEIFILENDEENRWIYDKIIQAVSIANQVHYDYELSGIIHGLQLIKYTATEHSNGHYDWHIDAGTGSVATRKLSITVQLSDPTDYNDCNLVVNDHGSVFSATRERGAINMFPSYMPHQVTPVTKGTRYALVIWVHGSRRFR